MTVEEESMEAFSSALIEKERDLMKNHRVMSEKHPLMDENHRAMEKGRVSVR
jgi:hypothetical protein